eukprot:5832776-Amphidinium_carterae.1
MTITFTTRLFTCLGSVVFHLAVEESLSSLVGVIKSSTSHSVEALFKTCARVHRLEHTARVRARAHAGDLPTQHSHVELSSCQTLYQLHYGMHTHKWWTNSRTSSAPDCDSFSPSSHSAMCTFR